MPEIQNVDIRPQENKNKNEHCRSPNQELDERSQSFTELKKIFQDRNLFHVPIKSYSSSDQVDDLEEKIKALNDNFEMHKKMKKLL